MSYLLKTIKNLMYVFGIATLFLLLLLPILMLLDTDYSNLWGAFIFSTGTIFMVLRLIGLCAEED